MQEEVIQGLEKFIDESPTAFHAVLRTGQILEENGFQRLYEDAMWSVVPGGKYYVVRNDTAIMAFVIPQEKINGFHVFAAHSDSPAFRIKCNPEMKAEGYYVKLNTEKYGGMIMAPWFDRPLSIAGRVTVKSSDSSKRMAVSSKYGLDNLLINFDKNMCVIPNVAIHMNRDMNQNLSYKAQTDMLPLIALQEVDEKDTFSQEKTIAQQLEINQEDILGTELYVYNREAACKAGMNDELILAPRLDDLECVYTGIQGLLAAQPKHHINMLSVFHNEEIGSLTRQGADSTFLKDTLMNIIEAMNMECFDTASAADRIPSKEKLFRMLVDNSFMMSADNAHAAHPNHGEKADPTNRPLLNKGIVLKFHGSQKYATDSYTEAMVREIAQIADVPVQTYHNHSDIAGGSTLGNIAMAQVSIPAADIGLAQLAMHSACETAGCKDVYYMTDFATAFFEK